MAETRRADERSYEVCRVARNITGGCTRIPKKEYQTHRKTPNQKSLPLKSLFPNKLLQNSRFAKKDLVVRGLPQYALQAASQSRAAAAAASRVPWRSNRKRWGRREEGGGVSICFLFCRGSAKIFAMGFFLSPL